MVNIVLCGTPGTGKTTIMNLVRDKFANKNLNLNFVDISKFAKENDCIDEYDAELDTHVIDDDKLEEKLKPIVEDPSNVNLIESIHPDIISERLIDHVFVLIMENHTHLFDRLTARNYNQAKLTNNVECEIFQEIKETSLEVFGHDKVSVLYNDTTSHLESNVQQIYNKLSQLTNVL